MIEVATEPVQKETLYRRMLKEIVEVKPSPDLCHTQFPPQVVIESTAACNQNCTFCGRSYLERPKGHMPRAIYNRIVDEIARESPLTEILPAYMGEALLLGDELFDRMATARRLGCRKITLNTNGTLVEKHVDRLLEGNIDRISVSCDAHTEATHRLVRPAKKTSGLEGVYRGVHKLLEERAKRGLARPFVEVGFTVFGETEHEVDDFVRYWSSHDVIIKTRPKGFHAGTVPGGDYRITTGEGRTPCGWLVDTMTVLWNGNVVLCAADVDAKFIAGNIEQSSLREMWNASLKWVREMHFRRRFGDLPEICRKCTDWQSRSSHTFYPNEATKAAYLDFVRAGRMVVYDAGSVHALPEIEP
ncbi:MAG: radical SAM protein [Myxococcales bacterium]|nr:radical SAM protein [Myxococcales bacterium]